MGAFTTTVYDGTHWRDDVPDAGDWLKVDVHDSDIAEVTFSPAGGARGLVYLGYQPRDYFENPAASPPLDLDAECAALIGWATRHGAHPDPERVRSLVAEIGEDPLDDFVEDTVSEFLDALGIPAP